MRVRAALVVSLLSWLAFSLVPSRAAAQGFVDPCLECGKIYSSDGSGNLHVIDPDAGVSTFLGSHGTTMFDIAASSDGRLAALRELATLELNLAAGLLGVSCPVELEPVMEGIDLTVRDARAEMQHLLALADDDAVKDARWMGEHVNNGEALVR